MAPPDPRRVVGGSVWARATHVSRDARRIYGVDADKKWLRGIVLEVLTSRPEGSRRATTLVKARYQVGDSEKIKLINLAQLKKEDQGTTGEAPPPAPGSPENLEQSSGDMPPLPLGEGTPAATTANTTVPGTTDTSSSTSTGSTRAPVYTCRDGREWFYGEPELPTNGQFVRKTWKFTDQYTSAEYRPGCDPTKAMKAIDFFMAVFPKKQMSFMVEKTNEALVCNGHPKVTKGELLKFFGVLILITRFEFADRANLWATHSRCKYIPPANLGERTGMTRDRFHVILRYLAWSYQPKIRPDGMSSEEYRWKLVDGFIDTINEHRSHYFSPSWLICADESISRWYGLGGHWINKGLPMYVAMDRKPEDGLEIQDSCCAKSGILLQLKLVKTAEANANSE